MSQLETSALRLDEYFTQLNNTSTQATLLLGFVLGIACNSSETPPSQRCAPSPNSGVTHSGVHCTPTKGCGL